MVEEPESWIMWTNQIWDIFSSTWHGVLGLDGMVSQGIKHSALFSSKLIMHSYCHKLPHYFSP